MAIPSWHDLIIDTPVQANTLMWDCSDGSEFSFDSYFAIGVMFYGSSHPYPNGEWSLSVPAYDESYPQPNAIYIRHNTRHGYDDYYDVSIDSNFTRPIPVGAWSDNVGYLIGYTKNEDLHTEPIKFKYSNLGRPYTISNFRDKLYLNFQGYEPIIYWVDESTTPATITEITKTDPPDPPDPPERNFEPVSYFKGNKTFFQMSMIKANETNSGELVTDALPYYFDRILSGDDLHALAHQLPVGEERFFAYTDNDNYVGIVRDGVDAVNGRTTYTLNFYTDGVFTNYVTYICNNSDKYHFSFLIDKTNNIARPSVIHEYRPVGRYLEFYDYNTESSIYITDAHMQEWYEWLSTSTDTEIPDPYSFGGNSETTSSTTGNYERNGDVVSVPSLPSFNSSSLGFFRAYLGNVENYDTISDLSNYLWSNNFDLDTFKKLFTNPIQAVLSIHLIPLAISSTELGHSVHLGNINTGLNMQPVEKQFIELDCGTLKVSEYFGSYLDYSPYTRLSLYLPFVGVVPLSIDEIMGKTIGIKYHIDLYTGACVAFVTADNLVLYHFSGMCAVNVPITSADASAMASSAISIGNTVATAVATYMTGGAMAPLIVPSLANTVSNVVSSKPHTQRSGSLSSSVGFIDNPIPYIILEIPEQCHPEDLNKFRGYPTYATFTLEELNGYTEVEEVHLENMTCTEREVQEIETLLKGGVIL